jgi:hypothetical protein
MMGDRSTVLSEEALDKIGLHVDMRITDVWAMLFERGTNELDVSFIGWLLRASYVTGYFDALSEDERGALCNELGYPIPGTVEA